MSKKIKEKKEKQSLSHSEPSGMNFRKYGLVKQSGAWYSYGATKWQGQDRMLASISKEDEQTLRQEIMNKWNEEFDFLNSVGNVEASD